MENEIGNATPEEERFRKTLFPREITLVLSGLHKLHSEAYRENNMPLTREIMALIDELKQGSGWNNNDEKGLIL